MGLFHGAANLGFVIGPILAGFVVQKTMNISPAFLALGVVGLAASIPLGSRLLKDYLRLPDRAFNIATIGAVFVLLSVIPVVFFGPLGAKPKEAFRYADLAMGTIIRLTLIAPNEKIADEAADKALATIHDLEQDFGHRTPGGSVGRINLAAGTAPVKVTNQAYRLIERSLGFSEKAKGVFDITIGAVTVTPNYFRGNTSQEKKELVDYRLVELDPDRQTVFLPKKGMAIDLGGLAKGTIIDLASIGLRNDGIEAGIVEGGGDFFCFGDKTWKIGIQHPRSSGLLGVIPVKNRGVCGSGDYYQYVIEEDHGRQERKHHILNPEKLRSAEKSISVTVLAPNTELADALATTLFIMGPEMGVKFLGKEFPNAAALWVLPDLKIFKTENFPEFLDP
jgi:thiamine biosynthesis lipoprotein